MNDLERDIFYLKRDLHQVLKDCELNGAGMRRLIQEFSDEVLGA